MRHDIVTVDPRSWPDVLATRGPAQCLAADAEALLRTWAGKGWPVIVRRRAPGEGAEGVPVGIPLPPRLGKTRVALVLPPTASVRRHGPVPLAEARDLAPAAWQGAIDAILSIAGEGSPAPRVFGALLWGKLTGLDYLHAGSDLDLLWEPGCATSLHRLLDALAAIQAACDVEIDGEILTPRGGVSWREIVAVGRDPDAVVLARTMTGASLVPVSGLYASGA